MFISKKQFLAALTPLGIAGIVLLGLAINESKSLENQAMLSELPETSRFSEIMFSDIAAIKADREEYMSSTQTLARYDSIYARLRADAFEGDQVCAQYFIYNYEHDRAFGASVESLRGQLDTAAATCFD